MIPFRTVSGRRIDLEHLTPDDIDLGDIVCALARCCRFAGHIRQHYSVAQHSLFVAGLCDPADRKAALLHDASEAYLGDLSRHLKHSEYLEGYRRLEGRVQDAIHDRFDVEYGNVRRQRIKAADDLAAIVEHIVLREHHRWVTISDVERLIREKFVASDALALAKLMPRLPDTITPLTIDEVEVAFLKAYVEATVIPS